MITAWKIYLSSLPLFFFLVGLWNTFFISFEITKIRNSKTSLYAQSHDYSHLKDILHKKLDVLLCGISTFHFSIARIAAQ